MIAWKAFLIHLCLITASYSMAESKCEIPCPLNADCIGLDRCKCQTGFVDDISIETGRPYCKPLCDNPCIENAECLAPNYCECVKGYSNNSALNVCEPICLSQCPHGRCIGPNQCECVAGFISVDATCMPAKMTTVGTTMIDIKASSYNHQTTSYEKFTTDSEEELVRTKRKNENLEELPNETTTATTNVNYSKQCPPTYIFFNGSCRPLIYDSCDTKICGPNSHCNEYGKCECLSGYSFEHQEGDSENAPKQCHRLLIVTIASKTSVPFYVALGSACILLAVLILVAIFIKKIRK